MHAAADQGAVGSRLPSGRARGVESSAGDDAAPGPPSPSQVGLVLIATDLDGTLLAPDAEAPSPYTVEVLRQVDRAASQSCS
jgi:hypothetical protein